MVSRMVEEKEYKENEAKENKKIARSPRYFKLRIRQKTKKYIIGILALGIAIAIPFLLWPYMTIWVSPITAGTGPVTPPPPTQPAESRTDDLLGHIWFSIICLQMIMVIVALNNNNRR